jgi:hypothetical protein
MIWTSQAKTMAKAEQELSKYEVASIRLPLEGSKQSKDVSDYLPQVSLHPSCMKSSASSWRRCMPNP